MTARASAAPQTAGLRHPPPARRRRRSWATRQGRTRNAARSPGLPASEVMASRDPSLTVARTPAAARRRGTGRCRPAPAGRPARAARAAGASSRAAGRAALHPTRQAAPIQRSISASRTWSGWRVMASPASPPPAAAGRPHRGQPPEVRRGPPAPPAGAPRRGRRARPGPATRRPAASAAGTTPWPPAPRADGGTSTSSQRKKVPRRRSPGSLCGAALERGDFTAEEYTRRPRPASIPLRLEPGAREPGPRSRRYRPSRRGSAEPGAADPGEERGGGRIADGRMKAAPVSSSRCPATPARSGYSPIDRSRKEASIRAASCFASSIQRADPSRALLELIQNGRARLMAWSATGA